MRGGLPNLHRALASDRDEFTGGLFPPGTRLQALTGVASAPRAARPYRGLARVESREVCPRMEVRIFANRTPTHSLT